MRAAQAAASLRRAISSGQHLPGDQLREVEMAQQLGISRNTLRESFALLIADGLVVHEPHRGVFIASPTIEDIRDLYASRRVIEPAALRWGTRLDRVTLCSLVEEAEAARERGDISLVAQANQQFHQEIVAGSGTELLAHTMQQLLARMRLVFLSAEQVDPHFHIRFIEDNRTIVTVLERDDRAGAAEMMHTTLGKACEIVVELVDQLEA